MSEFNFNSAICTTREQSERLLALGLKKETADMVHSTIVVLDNLVDLISEHPWTARQQVTDNWYPAWSLHRLLMMTTSKRKAMLIRYESDLFDVVIKRIEHEIKEGYFNKEYLV